MERIYLGWAAYITAMAVHLVYWRVGPGLLALKRAGATEVFGANMFPWVALSQIILLAWPFVAAGTLMKFYDVHVISVLMLWVGALVIAFIVSLFGDRIAMGWMDGNTRAGEGLYQVGAVLGIASPVLTAICYGFALIEPGYNGYNGY